MLTRVKASKNLALLRHEGAVRVDLVSDAVRERFATSGKHQIYADKREEAERFLKRTNRNEIPAIDDYPYLVAESQLDPGVITDLDAMTTLANAWVDTNKAWKRTAALIERISIRAKADIRNARGQPDIDRIVSEATASLEAVGDPLPTRPDDKPRPGRWKYPSPPSRPS
jgi:hypothetical protein